MATLRFVRIIAVGILLASGCACGRPSKDCFTGAVFEHARVTLDTYEQSLDANFAAYENATREAKRQGADIIVFPEGGLAALKDRKLLQTKVDNIPDPASQVITPCREDRGSFKPGSAVVRLSCLASRYGIYVVANLNDVKPCHRDQEATCPEDGFYLFNTDVAFNREGQLVARYHKNHPFFERHLNPAPKPEYVYFDTDFGRMGVFTCFDVVFEEAAKLVHRYGIESVVYPTGWHDELPVFSAPLVQQSFAILHNVNFLAANKQIPNVGTLGSGIYSGRRGALRYTHVADGRSKLLLAHLPRNASWTETCESRDDYVGDIKAEKEVFGQDYRYDTTDFSHYELVPLKAEETRAAVSSDGVTCHLDYRMKDIPSNVTLYLGVHNGTKVIHDYYQVCEEACVVVSCQSHGAPQCTRPVVDKVTTFDHLTLRGKYSTQYVLPNVAGKYASLVPKKEWDFSYRPGVKEATIALKEGSHEILGVFLNARCYGRDPPYVQ